MTNYDPSPTIDWNPLGEVYYRKIELYSMLWAERVDLSKYIVAAGCFGGPIALIKEESAKSGNYARLYIYTASGMEQASCKWDGGRLIQMGWSNTEDLVCIGDKGDVYVYDMFGSYKRQFSLGLEAQRSEVLEAKIFSSSRGTTGICFLTGDYQYFVVNNIDEVKVKPLQCPFSIEVPPSSWAVLSEPDGQGTKVLMAIDSNIYELDSFQSKEKEPPVSHPVKSFIEIAVSFNQKYVAMFADTGLLWIGSPNLENVYCEFNTHLQMRPTQLVWCGSGAVLGYWDNYLMMVGPTEDYVKYFVDSKVFLCQEVDGVRIIGNYKHDMLQKVPAEVEDIYRSWSKPGASLYDATKEFYKKSVRVDDYLKAIKDHLQEAVFECMKAAGHEFDRNRQEELMKAAAFGKSFVQNMKADSFVDKAKTIRVLNNVRDYKIGMPITYDQLEALTTPVFIDRLICRRFYYLAVKMCDYLRIPKRDGSSRVLAHWACYKVQQDNIDDNLLAKKIAEKIGESPGISYTEIASKALDRGRTSLAIKLLEYEPRAPEHVPLLLRANKEELALQKAIEIGDSKLITMVTEDMCRDMPLKDFLWKLRGFPTALALFIKSRKNQDRGKLTVIYETEEQYGYLGDTYVIDSFTESVLGKRIAKLKQAKNAYDKGMLQFNAQATSDQIRLLEFQKRLQDSYKKQFMNLSVTDTLYQLIYIGYKAEADTLRKEFSVPDTRFWWVKIQALAAAGDWDELEMFCKSKKSPIGYEPFVEACIKHGKKIEAEKYILKVPVAKRVKLYVKTGNLQQAAETAFQLKSLDDLDFVALKCGNNRSVTETVNTYRMRLQQKR